MLFKNVNRTTGHLLCSNDQNLEKKNLSNGQVKWEKRFYCDGNIQIAVKLDFLCN